MKKRNWGYLQEEWMIRNAILTFVWFDTEIECFVGRFVFAEIISNWRGFIYIFKLHANEWYSNLKLDSLTVSISSIEK